MFARGPISEISHLAAQITEESGEACGTESSKGLGSGGAQEYHFLTNPQWGFVTAGPETSSETIYPGWGTVVVEPDRCAVFFDGDLAGIVSPCGGRIGGSAVAARNENVAELEDAMVTAFRAEYNALTTATDDWKPTLASRTEG